MARIQTGKFLNPDTGEIEDKKEVNLTDSLEKIGGAVHITRNIISDDSPLVSAADYSKRTKSRIDKLKAAKEGQVPLGGAPPLDKTKMERLSGFIREASQGMARPSFPEPPGQPSKVQSPPPPPPRQKPVVQGVGSGFAYNQAMARGEVQSPKNLAEAMKMEEPKARKVSPEALEAIKAAAPPGKVELKTFPSPTPSTQVEEKSTIRKDIDDAEEAISQERLEELMGIKPEELDQVRAILISKERKKIIEERLEPIDFSDLILRREVRQHIPIIPGKFSLDLRTVQQYENFFCLEKMYKVSGSSAFIGETITTLRITCALLAINGSELPDHRSGVNTLDEKVDPEKFEHKLSIVRGLATPILADIAVQYDWFILRVNRLLSAENIKNG